MTQQTESTSAHGLVEYLDPELLHKNPAFTDFLLDMEAVVVVPLA